MKKELGKQTYELLEEMTFEPTKLGDRDQARVREIWASVQGQIDLKASGYELRFLRSDSVGPNAFALPNGWVVVTDDLVYLLRDRPDAILAILLHEIGHVERDHGLRLLAQSIGSTVVVGLVFGDLDGILEAFLGTGTTLVQNAFSRDMEREADAFALEGLRVLDKSPRAFAEALRALAGPESSEVDKQVAENLSYLQGHPAIEKRIQEALRASE